jgi:hypothetical protein
MYSLEMEEFLLTVSLPLCRRSRVLARVDGPQRRLELLRGVGVGVRRSVVLHSPALLEEQGAQPAVLTWPAGKGKIQGSEYTYQVLGQLHT